MAAAERNVVGDINWQCQTSKIVIDPEFRDLISPLTSEELDLLEKSLIDEGCRDALSVWNDDGILRLLDGHHRYAFCEKHNIPYRIDIIDGVNDRIDALIWIVINQLGRRNLSNFARSELALKLKSLIAAKAKENQGTRTDIQQNSAESLKPIETRDVLAKIANTSHDTISKTETVLKKGSDSLKEAARAGTVSVNAAAEIAELPLAIQDKIVKSDKQEITARAIKVYKKQEKRKRTKAAFELYKAPVEMDRVPKVIQIDCIAGLSTLQPKSVAAIVTSPPYNIGVDYVGSNDNKEPNTYLNWMRSVFASCMRVMKEDGHFFLVVGGTSTNPIIHYEVLQQALAVGFKFQNEIVWVKKITIGDISYGHFKPINSDRFVNHTYEFIFHLTKTGDAPINRLAIGVPFTDTSNVKRFDHTENLRCRGDVWFIPYDTIQYREERYNHPAIFPVALPEMCIKMSGIPTGSLVVDPFVGSGSTLVACQRTRMNGIGFDISAEYCRTAKIAIKRIDDRCAPKSEPIPAEKSLLSWRRPSRSSRRSSTPGPRTLRK
jgi:site-specific DNA-methyltransferase (adenine-specific)